MRQALTSDSKPRAPRLRTMAAVAAIAFLVGWALALQVRAQQSVNQSLSQQSSSALALLIFDLNNANANLQSSVGALTQQRSQLQQAVTAPSTSADLQTVSTRLEIATGQVGVVGPGIVLSFHASVGSSELQEIINDLYASGAEAIDIDGQRVISWSAISQAGHTLTLNGADVGPDWTISVIGDPTTLVLEGDQLVEALQATPGVSAAALATPASVTIRSVLAPKPQLSLSGQ